MWFFKNKKNSDINNRLKDIFSNTAKKPIEVLEVFDKNGAIIYKYSSNTATIDPDIIPVLLGILKKSENTIKNYLFHENEKGIFRIKSIKILGNNLNFILLKDTCCYLIAVISDNKNISAIEQKIIKNFSKLRNLKILKE